MKLCAPFATNENVRFITSQKDMEELDVAKSLVIMQTTSLPHAARGIAPAARFLLRQPEATHGSAPLIILIISPDLPSDGAHGSGWNRNHLLAAAGRHSDSAP